MGRAWAYNYASIARFMCLPNPVRADKEAFHVTEPLLYPVIDLLGGRLVRALRNGGDGQILADADPIAVALRWRAQGAQWLHLVDLDGARDGAPRQTETIRAIIEAVGLPAQVAGGLRDTASVEAALAAGATRVVLSAATPDDQALVAECVARWGERIAVALEARDGRVTVAGWLPSDAATALDVARAMSYLGAATMLFTSMSTGGGSDPLPGALRRALPDMRLITGGSVSSLADLRRQLALGVDGVLLGRGLYDGLFTLEEALTVAREVGEITPSLARRDEETEQEAESLAAMISDGPTIFTALEMPVFTDALEAPGAASPDQPERVIEDPRDGGAAAGEDADRG